MVFVTLLIYIMTLCYYLLEDSYLYARISILTAILNEL